MGISTLSNALHYSQVLVVAGFLQTCDRFYDGSLENFQSQWGLPDNQRVQLLNLQIKLFSLNKDIVLPCEYLSTYKPGTSPSLSVAV